VAAAPWEGFEPTISVPSQSYVAVQALDADGRVIGHSHTIRVV
jgi:hypothetical protein